MMCQHCHVTPISRPRRLCWSCYYAPGVRDLYPATSKFGLRGPGAYQRDAAPPAFPTTAPPGSPEKIAVLTERVRRRQSLGHPEDADLRGATQTIAQAG